MMKLKMTKRTLILTSSWALTWMMMSEFSLIDILCDGFSLRNVSDLISGLNFVPIFNRLRLATMKKAWKKRTTMTTLRATLIWTITLR